MQKTCQIAAGTILTNGNIEPLKSINVIRTNPLSNINLIPNKEKVVHCQIIIANCDININISNWLDARTDRAI